MDAGCPLSRSNAPLIPARVIRGCSNIVLPRETVERAARRHPNADVAPGFLGPGGVQLFDRETRALAQPTIGQVRGFEWSPDEAWVALATANDV